MKIGRVNASFQTDLLYTEHYLAKELKNDGHETVFITSNHYMPSWDKYITRKDGPGYYTFENFTVYRLSSFFPLQKAIFKSFRELQKIIEKERFDVLHLYGLGSLTTLQILFLAIMKSSSFPPIIISDHTDVRTHKREGVHANLFYFCVAIALKFLSSKITKVITFNESSIQLLSFRFKLTAEKFSLIPLGYDQETYFYNANFKNEDPKIVFGFAGKIDAKKRVDVLIDVLEKSTINTNSKLIIVGITNDDYCDKLRSKAQKSAVEIEFRPFSTKEELCEFYNYIDVAVYPGGISITTIEANGCGTPVILYKSIPNLESRVENGRGVLFDTNKELESALATYYDQYLQGAIDNQSIAAETRKKYSWGRIKDSYLEIYKSCLVHE